MEFAVWRTDTFQLSGFYCMGFPVSPYLLSKDLKYGHILVLYWRASISLYNYQYLVSDPHIAKVSYTKMFQHRILTRPIHFWFWDGVRGFATSMTFRAHMHLIVLASTTQALETIRALTGVCGALTGVCGL